MAYGAASPRFLDIACARQRATDKREGCSRVRQKPIIALVATSAAMVK